ncbi:MAG: winged helix-turn-helix domain-containing protein [Nitrosarchaeum sp.]|nr:winged helix-turn-helix domain-containing protein [Nitrosarchaeum sp.]
MIDKNSITENAVNIFSLDDVKMKVLAKVISNKSSIEILNLLFDNQMTANEIAKKTNMSLQLVKYYLDMMLQIELIQISKTEKNSKARDMNYYKTSKLAIIITPSKITEKTKQSKSLVRCFSSISRFFGMSVISTIAAMSLITISAESRLLEPIISWYSKFNLPIAISGTGIVNSVDESLYLSKTKVESVISNPGAGSGTPYLDPYTGISSLSGTDITLMVLILAGIGGILSFIVFNKLIHTLQKNPSTC